MMKLFWVFLIAPVFFFSCSGEKSKIKSGQIIYAIEYPTSKDNFMLYSILPKEMKLDFNGQLMKCTIAKANLVNQLFINCDKRNVSAYFEFGADMFYVNMNPQDINEMIAGQKAYNVDFSNETDTLAGFDVKKAVATAKDDPSDVIELWYTDQIDIKNSNWYNPFKKVPGVLLKYAIDRYGLRMEFTAKGFSAVEVAQSDLVLKPKGNKKNYADYNAELSGLFKTFE